MVFFAANLCTGFSFISGFFFSSEAKSNLSCAAWLEVGISGSCVSNQIFKSSILQFQWFLYKDKDAQLFFNSFEGGTWDCEQI